MYVKERFCKEAEKLQLENEELFDYFGKLLIGNAQMEWERIDQEIDLGLGSKSTQSSF